MSRTPNVLKGGGIGGGIGGLKFGGGPGAIGGGCIIV